MALHCLSASGVFNTKKLQILKTKFVLIRRKYNQEEEKDLQNIVKKYIREEI